MELFSKNNESLLSLASTLNETSSKSPYHNPGYTFAKASREGKRLGESSPGPIYSAHEIHNNTVSKSFSIPKSARVSIFDKITSMSPGPASSSNNILDVKPKGTSAIFPRSKRFTEDDIRHKESKLTPGPGDYADSRLQSMTIESPSFSFGSKKLNKKNLFSDQADTKESRSISPGPIYEVTSSLHKIDTSPKISFPKGKRSFALSLIEYPKDEKPSPGQHEIRSKIGKGTPSFSFGTSSREVHIIPNNRFAANMNGEDSPGPIYNPDISKVKDKIKNIIFGSIDREEISPNSFAGARRLLVESYFKESPGPTSYNPEKDNSSPKITLKGKEKEIVGNVYPHVRRSRFLSNDLASENQGQWSPGPKYMLPSSLSGPKFSFAASNNSRRPVAGALRNDYEKMYIGPGMPMPMPETPGPKYNIRKKPAADAKRITIPKAGMNSEKNKIKLSEIPGPGHYDISEVTKIGRTTTSSTFKSMGKPNKNSSRLDFGTLGRDSPGPAYSFDLNALAKHSSKRGVAFGQLS